MQRKKKTHRFGFVFFFHSLEHLHITLLFILFSRRAIFIFLLDSASQYLIHLNLFGHENSNMAVEIFLYSYDSAFYELIYCSLKMLQFALNLKG